MLALLRDESMAPADCNIRAHRCDPWCRGRQRNESAAGPPGHHQEV